MKRYIIFFVINICIPVLLFGQGNHTISGNITDATTNEPVEGATVALHETQNYAITDAAGNYLIQNVKPGIYHIHIDLLGYKPIDQTIEVKGDHVIDFKLRTTFIELHEVLIEEDVLKAGIDERPLSISVANKEFLERNFDNTLSSTLSKLPGVSSITIGSGLGKPVIRGLSSNRVIINNKGIKQEGQQWGADHGLEIDQYEVDRVEVVKGPASLLYGSDGIGGVINILPAAIPNKNTFSGEVIGLYRSNNDLYSTSVAVEGNQGNIFYHLRYSLQDYGDYRVPAEEFVYNTYRLPIYDKTLKNTAGQEENISATIGLQQPWGNIRLSVNNVQQKVGFFAGAVGVPRAYQLTPDESTRDIDLPFQEVDHTSIILNSKIMINRSWIHTDIGYQINNRREETVPHNHGDDPSPHGSTAHLLDLRTFSLNSKYHKYISDATKLVTGISFQQQVNFRDGFEYLIPNYYSLGAGAFVFMQHSFNPTTHLSGGIRYDQRRMGLQGYAQPIYNEDTIIKDYNIRALPVEKSFGNVSGSLGISKIFHEHWNLKVNIGRSFRTPVAPELSANGVHHGTFRHEMGSADITSETGYHFDLGFSYKRQKIYAEVTPFFNYFDNYIYLRPSANFSPLPDAGLIYRYSQADAVHTGFEVVAEYHPMKNLHAGIMAEYVWNVNLETYLPLPFTPPLTITATADHKFKDFTKWLRAITVGAEAIFTAAQNRTDRNEDPTPGYELFNAFTAFNIYPAGTPVSVTFRVSNIFNTKHLSHLSRYRILNLPEQGRNFSIMVKVPVQIKTAK